MSPLGPISIFPQLQPPQVQLSLQRLALEKYWSPPCPPPRPETLLRFMSVSLGGHGHRRRHGSHRHSFRNMTLLNDREVGTAGGAKKSLLHGIRNFITPEPPETPTPPRETEALTKPTEEDTDGEEIDVDDSMSTVTMTTASQSPSPSSSHSVCSPTPLEPESRTRHYSSEDSVSQKSLPASLQVGYNPLSSLNEALINNSFQQEQQRQQASLLFSIANILRPDFGLGRLPPPPPPLTFTHLTKPHPLHHPHTVLPKRKSTYPDSLHSKKPKADIPVIPIDLSSRPLGPRLKHGGGRSSSSHHRTKVPEWSQKLKPSHERGEVTEKESGDLQPTSPEVKTGQTETTKSLGSKDSSGETNWPAWVYCTRYSDRPSSGPRSRRGRKQKEKEVDEKRPRTAFTADQLSRLQKEFADNKYLTEKRRQDLATDLQLHENQIKIWFQNKRAKLKKSSGQRGRLAEQLRAQGLYNHSTIQSREDDDEEESD